MTAINIDMHARVTDLFAAIGIEPPAELVRIEEAERALQSRIHDDPTASIRETIAAGNVDPAKLVVAVEKAAVAMLQREKVQVIYRGDVSSVLAKRRRAVLRENAEGTVEAMRPAFASSADSLAATLEHIAPDADPKVITASAGPATAVVLAQRTEAVGLLDNVKGLYGVLVGLGYGGQQAGRRLHRRPVGASLFVDSLADRPDLERANALLRAGWPLLAATYTLRLNTPAEADAVEQGAHSASDEAERAEREAAGADDRRKDEREMKRWRDLAAAAGRATS